MVLISPQHVCHRSSAFWSTSFQLGCEASTAAAQMEPTQATPPTTGRSRTLAPYWCIALMFSKAYLLLGFYLHPLSLSASGQPSCLRHVPGACLQQVWSALLFARPRCLHRWLPAVPDSGACADNVCGEAFGDSVPDDITLSPAFFRCRARLRSGAHGVLCRCAQAAPGSTGGLLPGGLIDISVTQFCIIGTWMQPLFMFPLGSCQQHEALLGQNDSLLFTIPAYVLHFLQG